MMVRPNQVDEHLRNLMNPSGSNNFHMRLANPTEFDIPRSSFIHFPATVMATTTAPTLNSTSNPQSYRSISGTSPLSDVSIHQIPLPQTSSSPPFEQIQPQASNSNSNSSSSSLSTPTISIERSHRRNINSMGSFERSEIRSDSALQILIRTRLQHLNEQHALRAQQRKELQQLFPTLNFNEEGSYGDDEEILLTFIDNLLSQPEDTLVAFHPLNHLISNSMLKEGDQQRLPNPFASDSNPLKESSSSSALVAQNETEEDTPQFTSTQNPKKRKTHLKVVQTRRSKRLRNTNATSNEANVEDATNPQTQAQGIPSAFGDLQKTNESAMTKSKGINSRRRTLVNPPPQTVQSDNEQTTSETESLTEGSEYEEPIGFIVQRDSP
jgi:hypothetical protein